MVRSRLAVAARGRALPFVIEEGPAAIYGFASHAWVADLYRWARCHAPLLQRDRIIGLLHGYSPDTIRGFEELGSTLGPFQKEDTHAHGQVPHQQPVPEVRHAEGPS
jgi:hypothetical protein